jgi:hypothetical protein
MKHDESNWGTYEDACKILRRSKDWYNDARMNKERQKLFNGEDWRRVGKEIEYYLPSIRRVKDQLIKQSA